MAGSTSVDETRSHKGALDHTLMVKTSYKVILHLLCNNFVSYCSFYHSINWLYM